jgi:hemerythrin
MQAKGDFPIEETQVLVDWDNKYSVRIPLIDEQHKHLIRLTNDLYQACLSGGEAAKTKFRDTARAVADYIKYHFSAEEKILERINYPELPEHKRQHETLIRQVIDNIKHFEEGGRFAPNAFVRTLKDWILAHIAVADLRYAEYIMELKKGSPGIRTLNKE